jgi:predicted dehydrogenase
LSAAVSWAARIRTPSKVNQFFELDAQPVLKAVCPRNPETAEAFARNCGYESFETDWRALVRRPDIDLIDIASPNDTHMEIAIAAAERARLFSARQTKSVAIDQTLKIADFGC